MRRRRVILVLLLAGASVSAPTASRGQALTGAGAHVQREDHSQGRSFKSACIPVVAIACGLAGGALGAVGDVAGGIVGAGASAVGNTVLDGVAGWVGQGAAWLIDRIGKQVERSTRPALGAAWFSRQ